MCQARNGAALTAGEDAWRVAELRRFKDPTVLVASCRFLGVLATYFLNF